MFSIYYAGSVFKPQVTPDHRERTEEGKLMADLMMGLDWFIKHHGSITYDTIQETHTKIGDTMMTNKDEIFDKF